ncbi:MAG TPA: gamma-glutamyltransferase family protein [Burkholderiales bacterium]|nr:gamma-glutamyltransferase family protein [Burkholderiales bacterium]
MTSFSWTLPYASRRSPVLARNVVATTQPLAAQAGLRMLLRGGNAVDAAVATAAALTVVEPVMNGIGSDAFAIVWDGKGLNGLNASGRAPRAWTPQRFSGRTRMPTEGWDSVTVPGVVSAWAQLSARFGKLPFEDLFGPAISYARDGFPVSPVVAQQWELQVPRLKDQPGFAQAFLRDGRAPRAGEIFRFPEQADTLADIARTRGESYYRGALAERIAAFSASCGGAMTVDDLGAHQADWVEPIGQDYRGYRVHEIPPNGQGIAALMALGMLQHLDLPATAVDSVASLHLQVEAMKLGFVDTYHHVADPRAMRVRPSDLLDPEYLKMRARLIRRDRASEPVAGLPPSGTIYLSAADAGGMMVSYIQSNYMGFGSGVVVPGTGISLQNRGSGFSLAPGHPNLVAGGKRPFHTIIPAFLTREGRPVMSFGVMGADMQPQGHLQMTVRVVDYGQNPQAAADAPRWKIALDGTLLLEHAVSDDVVAGLAALGHRVVRTPPGSMEYGAAQLVHRLDGDAYLAASEPRRDGQAAGF